jgi:heat shock protein HslJ
VEKRFVLQDGQLTEVADRILAVGTDITDVTWQWVRFDSGDGSTLDVDDPARYTLTLRADGTYQVVADCNRAGGAYTLDGSSLILQPGPTTLAECQPGSLYAEFLRKLGDVRTYVTDDGKLVLNLWADAGNMVFVPVDRTAGLEDTLWELKGYLDEAGTLVGVLPGTQITVEFRAGQVAGSAGCNRYFGSYQLDANNLTLGPLGTTMMVCETDVGGQERLYLAALEKVASYRIVDGLLELVDAGGNTVLTFGKVVHAPLTGTTWKLTSYHDGKSALVSVLAGSEVNALFAEDGKLGGSAGCNNYTTGYEIDGQSLSFGPVATTRKMCAEPEGIMEQESAYLAALERVTAYRIQGDSLELLDAEGGRVATFDAETG